MYRKTKQPSELSALLNSSTGTLAQITKKTNSLSTIADIVRQICPDLPEDSWHLGNISADIVYIEVKSAVWGQRFQFERMNIVKALQAHTEGLINRIEIKVNPAMSKKPKVSLPDKGEKTQFISQETAQELREIAANSSAPDSLKRKLERLAKLAK